jgi:hypothetical protein
VPLFKSNRILFQVINYENIPDNTDSRAFLTSAMINKGKEAVSSLPKTIDTDWLRSREERLLHQSDVVNQRLQDMNQGQGDKRETFTAYHGISHPKRKLLESQVALIQMRKKRRDEAVAQHQARRAILKYIEAWRIRTIHRCHYLACKKKAKRYRLNKAMNLLLERCVFTCKAHHSVAVVARMYVYNRKSSTWGKNIILKYKQLADSVFYKIPMDNSQSPSSQRFD